jgi:hypothetical protein
VRVAQANRAAVRRGLGHGRRIIRRHERLLGRDRSCASAFAGPARR